MNSKHSRDIRTLSVQAGCAPKDPSHPNPNLPVVPAIAQSSVFHLGTSEDAEELFSGRAPGYTYSRFGNPTVMRLAESIAQMEGDSAEALVTSSGNAASLCALTAALRGEADHVLCSSDVYGGTQELLRIFAEQYRLPVTFADPSDAEDWRAAISRASVVFVETPSNPLLKLIDIEETAALAHGAGAQLIVDNTVATPYNQQPLNFGADWVVHSISKYLNGHSDLIAGCVVRSGPLSAKHRSIHKNLGGSVNAMDAWLALRGLRSFALRMEVHNRNAAAVAEFLAGHPRVSRVYYPSLGTPEQVALFKKQMPRGGSGLVSFEIEGGESAAKRFLDRIRVFIHAVSLGGMESLATRPASTSHRGMTSEQRKAAGISESLVRLSVGVEAVEDLIADLDQALEAAG